MTRTFQHDRYTPEDKATETDSDTSSDETNAFQPVKSEGVRFEDNNLSPSLDVPCHEREGSA